MKKIVTRYESLANEISSHIRAGVLRPGDRISSVRSVTRTRGLSSNTVLQAYHLLEDRGEIRARARSGYYVVGARVVPVPDATGPIRSNAQGTEEIAYEVFQNARLRGYAHFGSAWPSAQLYPLKRLGQAFALRARAMGAEAMPPYYPRENNDLKRQILRRSVEWGFTGKTDEAVLTAGAFEALNLCLRVATRPGDLVAIEEATLFGIRSAIQRYGLRAIEIPTHPRDGMSLSALSAALKKHPIRACICMPTFQHPLGSLMSDDRKRELVRLLASRDVPLIENDVCGELHYGDTRPRPAKAFDRKGLVLYCGSFSKSLAPGYAVGWALAGKFARAVQLSKWTANTLSGIPSQGAVAEFIEYGGYEHHLRRLRRTLATLQKHCRDTVMRSFPAGTAISAPQGGYVAWVQLPKRISALKLYRLALESKITIAPGIIFAGEPRYENCFRLNYGQPWSSRLEDALQSVGAMASSIA